MGILSDFFSISNSIDIGDLQRQNQAQLRLAEFRERADALARQTGMAPMGFFAFEKTSPTPTERAHGARWWGALIGAAIGSFGGLLGTGVGTAIGFTAGAFSNESESTRLNRALERYETYLTSAEITAHAQMRAPIFSMDAAEQAHSNNHAADILAARAAAEHAVGHAV